MNLKTLIVVPAIVLTLGAAPALAQLATHPFAPFGQASLAGHTPTFRPGDPASAMTLNAAFVGDGATPSYLRDQRELQREFNYDVPGG